MDRYKVERLFLLIGRNPMPNYVAAKLLTKQKMDGGKSYLYLVHSKDDGKGELSSTKRYADRLQKVLGKDAFAYEFLPVEPSNPTSVATEINKHLSRIPQNESVGLNYTGGTKAMSVHAYDAIRRWKEKRQVFFSYLDPRRLAMCIDPEMPGAQPVMFELGHTDTPDEKKQLDTARISLEQLLSLHGLRLLERGYRNPRAATILPEVVQAIWEEHESYDTKTSNGWRTKLRSLVEECKKVGGRNLDKEIKGRPLTGEERAEYW